MSKLYDLKPFQQEVFMALKSSFARGLTRPLVYASVAFGKTILATHIVAGSLDKGKRIMFVAPYTALINQTAESFMKQGIPKPGVMQADHPFTDPANRLQIASVQTLARREMPEVDIIIVDECHLQYKIINDIMENTNIPVIGLTGSPFSKGLGKHYNNLIKAPSMKKLIKEGYLSDYIAYSHERPDLKGIRTVAGDYHEGQLGERCSDPKLVGDVIKTWLKLGGNQPTICFAVNVSHAEFLGVEFERSNVSCAVITGRTPAEEREIYFKGFRRGNIKILINVGVLTAGFDADVRCLIDAAPTKSEIRHVQRYGRALRTAAGKEHAILLDHSGNLLTLGFPDDIDIDELCTGEKNEAGKVEKKAVAKKEKLPKVCSKCQRLKEAGEHECSSCGFTPKFFENVEVDETQNLHAIKSNKKHDREDKQRIYSELKGLKAEDALKGRPKSDGYYSHLYKDLVGCWPKGMTDKAITPSEQLRGFVKHKKIAFAKSRNK